MGIAVGDRVRDVAATTHAGEAVRLSQLTAGRALVVFFYPKAFTPGCTTEACHFRDRAAEFDEAGASLVGISRDTVETQAGFAVEHGLTFPLLADRDGVVARAFGAKRVGPLPPRRQTFVVDRDLTLLGRFSSETDMRGHADGALELLRSRRARA